mmetsp:Transcript_46616/g.68900  ORF Transcript_46616/g.68900 Transcript_46616/m.68900 type:complete len:93 (+) Transcript_46616:68-346(+)
MLPFSNVQDIASQVCCITAEITIGFAFGLSTAFGTYAQVLKNSFRDKRTNCSRLVNDEEAYQTAKGKGIHYKEHESIPRAKARLDYCRLLSR